MASKISSVRGPDDWETSNDVRTLAEAEKIKGDKKRHAKAKNRARQMAADLQAVHQAPTGKTKMPSDNDGDE